MLRCSTHVRNLAFNLNHIHTVCLYFVQLKRQIVKIYTFYFVLKANATQNVYMEEWSIFNNEKWVK